MKVRQRSVFEDKVREGARAFDRDSVDGDQGRKEDQGGRDEDENHGSLGRARTEA